MYLPKGIYGAWLLFFVSARTNKRHHHLGVALTLDVRAARQGPSTRADESPGAPSHSSASSCLDDRVREAAKWLQAAFNGGVCHAKLHLAHLTFCAGQEDAALAHLKDYLSWRVQWGRDKCHGCGQTRGEDTPMLTCSGYRVARFCSADHQKMASKKAASGGSLTTGGKRTSAACSASGARLSKAVWRLTRALRSWWRFCSERTCDAPRTQRERQRQFSHNGGPGRRPAERGRESVLE